MERSRFAFLSPDHFFRTHKGAPDPVNSRRDFRMVQSGNDPVNEWLEIADVRLYGFATGNKGIARCCRKERSNLPPSVQIAPDIRPTGRAPPTS
jgi:hypothetical protein